jgi:alginate O-acetyltransferase complex protein AlgI
LALIVASGLLDFFCGLGMRRTRWRKALLGLSIAGNVGSLLAFKYSGFLAGSLDGLLAGLGLHSHLGGALPEAMMILPVGISFYTFQSMSYTIDVYRGRMEPTGNVLHFFAYLSMFPQLVAGPIVRAADLLPQLREARETTETDRWEGTVLVVGGFFKKVVVADTIAPVVTAAFSSPQLRASCPYWWIIMLLFSFQIYCDFSGYSDIARGLARWMGYEFPLNFNHPYVSRSIREFWSRWHISLSTWFRDYIYIPLGGSRRGEWRTHRNLWITMLVSGFWHGAAWTFVIWGAVHAALLSLERVTSWPQRLEKLRFGRHVTAFATFVLVMLTWVFFRAESLSQAASVLGLMFNPLRWDVSGIVSEEMFKALGVVMLMVVRQALLGVDAGRFHGALLGGVRPLWQRALSPAMVGLGIAACVLLRGPGSAFIYFRF